MFNQIFSINSVYDKFTIITETIILFQNFLNLFRFFESSIDDYMYSGDSICIRFTIMGSNIQMSHIIEGNNYLKIKYHLSSCMNFLYVSSADSSLQ